MPTVLEKITEKTEQYYDAAVNGLQENGTVTKKEFDREEFRRYIKELSESPTNKWSEVEDPVKWIRSIRGEINV